LDHARKLAGLSELPQSFDHQEVYRQVFSKGKTDAIFQFESGGMKDLCRKMQPSTIEHLSALNALFRPGPLDSGLVENYLRRRRGDEEIDYIFPELKEVLESTFGVIVYQEQVMALFQVLADYSLSEADLVRRAMGKKKREELDAHKDKFINKAEGNGFPRPELEKLWLMLEGFADYAFNKSHSTAYAVLAYQTAYMKHYHPREFWAAVLTAEEKPEKVAHYLSLIRNEGIELKPPCIRRSQIGFSPDGNGIRFGLTNVKGIGEKVAEGLIAQRPYKDVAGVRKAARINVFESLLKAGAVTTDNRLKSEYWARFCPEKEEPDWNQAELDTIGMYLSFHPLDPYRHVLDRCQPIGELTGTPRANCGGQITGFKVAKTKTGKDYATFQLVDFSGSVKCLVWEEQLRLCRHILQNGAIIGASGKVEDQNGSLTMFPNYIAPLSRDSAAGA
jgi:DNA polymerase-3 subunit alpha